MGRIPPRRSAALVRHTEEVLEVHRRPSDPKRPVVRLDETFARRVGGTREPLPPAPGRVERCDRVHVRDGTAGLLLAFEPLAGRRHVAVTDGRRRVDRAALVRAPPEGRCRDAETVVPVMDRLDTHAPASPYEAFPPEQAGRLAGRLEIRHAPERGSWLSLAEVELGAPARDPPERIGGKPAPGRRVRARERTRNGAEVAARRRSTTADARIRLRKLYPTIDVRRSTSTTWAV